MTTSTFKVKALAIASLSPIKALTFSELVFSVFTEGCFNMSDHEIAKQLTIELDELIKTSIVYIDYNDDFNVVFKLSF